MSETPLPESQHQRWLKYGVNVVVATILVIALAVLMIYITQKNKRRFDTTGQSVNSLKEQTKNILKDLKTNVTLVSLYTRTGTNRAEDKVDYVGQVEDLLDEYKRNSSHVDLELIDPVANPTKVDDLIHKVTEKYGGEVKKYKEFLAEYPAKYEKISAIATAEAANVAKLPFEQIKTQELVETVVITVSTVQGFPKALEQGKQRIDRQLKQKPPDYKGATESIDQTMQQLSEMTTRIIEDFTASKDNVKVPQAFRDYMSASLPQYQEVKKIADGIVADIGKLGELKLDSLRQSLRERDSILVMGENDLKVLPFNKVWKSEIDRKPAAGGDLVRPQFAGEQQVTTAILSLTAEKKQKVVFLRPGGPPVAERSPFQRAGEFSFAEVADRLRDSNFEVVEKDFNGMYEMQAQMQQQPVAPEPSDADIKEAIWIVLNVPTQGQMGMPPPSVVAKLSEHLNNGGSALVLSFPRADALDVALSPWGVKLDVDQIAVKQLISGDSGAKGDEIEQAEKKYQHVFIIKDFGDHLLTKPLRSLEAAILPIVPVEITPKDGYTATPIIPVPTSPPSWATDISHFTGGGEVKFDPKRGDKPPPIFGGAVVEKKGGGRLVVIGALEFATDNLVNMPDPELEAKGYRGVPRFPGNAELFANSIYWLAHMEPMIAISPSALQISRIAPMSDSAAKAWNVGVLLFGLPGLVIVAGVMMYLARRD
ncbi:hypothetical protein BH10PLA1_BH10PLA1_03980 [soil metagenome]